MTSYAFYTDTNPVVTANTKRAAKKYCNPFSLADQVSTPEISLSDAEALIVALF
jgi:hypothetical protein